MLLFDGKQVVNEESLETVITLVLYFGTTRWNKPTTLYESLAIDDELKPYVSDYKINLFEIAFLEPEQVAKFQSDFRIVADYFVQMRTNKAYVPSKETFTHVDEILKLFSVLTNDSRFADAQADFRKDGVTMCEVLDRVEARGVTIGMVVAFHKAGFPAEQIADEVGISVEEVLRILATRTSEDE